VSSTGVANDAMLDLAGRPRLLDPERRVMVVNGQAGFGTVTCHSCRCQTVSAFSKRIGKWETAGGDPVLGDEGHALLTHAVDTLTCRGRPAITS